MPHPLPDDSAGRTPVGVIAFRSLLLALVLSTTVGVGSALRDRAGFVASFPGAARDLVFYLLVATGLLGLVAVLGLWRWRQWGVVLFLAVTVASFSLDVIARAPAMHQVAVLTVGLLVGSLVYANRERFAR